MIDPGSGEAHGRQLLVELGKDDAGAAA